jgi:hypothetical protein
MWRILNGLLSNCTSISGKHNKILISLPFPDIPKSQLANCFVDKEVSSVDKAAVAWI